MAQGIAHLTHLVEKLQIDMDRLLCRIDEIERRLEIMAGSVADLDTVLGRVEDATTKLGNDLKDVFAFIKANPGVDLTAQIARGSAIADTLIQADADALAQENPLPPPTP